MRGWPLTVEHVIPQAAWLETQAPNFLPNDRENLAVACYQCNIIGKRAHTRGIDPLSGAEVELFHPRRQRWSDHFEWSIDYLTLKGKTPTGWATIAVLRLNGPRYRAQRRLLRLAIGGWRPLAVSFATARSPTVRTTASRMIPTPATDHAGRRSPLSTNVAKIRGEALIWYGQVLEQLKQVADRNRFHSRF
jgi:hypothetical protein